MSPQTTFLLVGIVCFCLTRAVFSAPVAQTEREDAEEAEPTGDGGQGPAENQSEKNWDPEDIVSNFTFCRRCS